MSMHIDVDLAGIVFTAREWDELDLKTREVLREAAEQGYPPRTVPQLCHRSTVSG